MSENPLASLADYSRFVAELLDRPTVTRSTVMVWSDSPFSGVAEGEGAWANNAAGQTKIDNKIRRIVL